MRSALEWPGNAPATVSPAMLFKVEGEQALAAVEPGPVTQKSGRGAVAVPGRE